MGNDTIGQIKGYASAASINKGSSIDFYVSVNTAQNYTIDVYRVGWYQGLGGRLMQHAGPFAGVHQTTCPMDATTGMIECHWAISYTLATQTTWTSGVYVAVLTNAQQYQNYILFTVRDDNRIAPLMYQVSVTSHQAYNDYPNNNTTGKSLYDFNSYGPNTVGGGKAAVKVSFDRPYMDDGSGGDFRQYEVNFLRWIEKSGYDVTYSTDIDTHTNGSHLLNFRGFLSVGHDEYWSKQMYDAAIAARNAGVNLAFFTADAVYWAIRFEPSSTGVPNRVQVCYRDASIDPNPDPSLKTILWRDPPLNRPEQTLMGVQFTSQVPWHSGPIAYVTYVVGNSANWVYAGTGFKDGDTVPGIVGYEADRYFSEYPSPTAVSGTYSLLSHSPYTGDFSNSSVYQAPSGAWVFASGTMDWAWGLDNYSNGANTVDARIQRTTANVLDRFIGNAQPDFTLTPSPSSQSVQQAGSTSYGVTITPAGTFGGQVTLSVTGLPTGATGTFNTNPATTSSTLAVTTLATTPAGTYTLTITGVSGALTRTTTATLVVTVPVPPDFTLSGSPASQTVLQGGSTSYGVTIATVGGFSGQVTLSVTGLPTGATGSFNTNPATTSSTLAVTTAATTPAGTYTLTITGVSGALTHTTTTTLVVNIPPPPDFTLSGSPASQSVTQGGSTSYGVTITPTSGFSGQVTLSVTGLPTGATGTFNTNPATTTSTLAVATVATTPAGTYTLTITGINGSLTHTATVSLTVSRPGVAYDNKVSSDIDFGVTTVTTPAFVIGSAANRAATIMVSMSGNNATNITAKLGGVTGTLIPGTDSGTAASIRTLMFQVINPPSGSQTATVSWTTSMHVDVGVITASGVDQSTPCINGTNTATNSTAAATSSLTVTSSPGDLTASVGFSGNGWVTPFTNQTLKWGIDSGEVGGDIGPGTGTTTHTWKDQYAFQTHAVSGANFKAVSGLPDYTLSGSPASQTVVQGALTSYGVTIAPTGGFGGQVTLSVTGLPTGATGTFNTNPATTTSTLAVTTAATTPAGTYTLTMTGVSGSLTHTATVSLVVNVPADFTVSGSPASQTVVQGASTSYGVTIAPVGGFSGPVTLSVTGLPTGATGTFTPNPATTSSNLAVTTAATTPTGTYTLTVTGVNGSLTHTATVTLVVNVLPDFTVSGSPASQTVVQGASTSYGVTIAPTGGFGGSVTLSVTGLPTGATGTFTPNPATASSNLAVTTAANTPTGTYTLTVTGVNGSLTHTTTVTLVVNVPPDFTVSGSPASQTVVQGNSTNYGVTIAPTGGFGGSVTLSVTGLPTGATGTFTPNPATTTSNLAVTTAASTPTGNYTLTVTGVSGSLTHTTTVTLVVNASSDFGLSGSPGSQTVIQGNSTSYGVTIAPTGGFSSPVTLSVTGLPTGATSSFDTNPATTTSNLGVTTIASTPAGTYTLTITGVSGSLTHSTSVTLVVNVPPDFTVSGSPASQTVIQGGSTNYGVTLASVGGFSGPVTLSATGLPTGATGTFNINPATTTSTLAVTTAASTPAGTYTLTITGVNGSLTHIATVTLVVNVPPDFSVSGSPTSQSVIRGSATSYGITIAPVGGFSGSVTQSVTGLPTGATGTFSPNPATTTSNLAVTTGATTPAGTYTLTINGVSGSLTRTTTVTLIVNLPPDFTLSGSPTSQSVIRGSAASYGITIAPVGGFSGSVTQSVTGLPTGATGTFTPNPGTTSSTLVVTTAATTPAGTFTLTITGISGSLTHTTTVTLIVTVPPDFSLTGSPASATIVQGRSTNYGITIAPVGGFAGQVTLSVTGLPTGATGTFNTNPATTTSTLAVATVATTPVGTYTLTVTGVNGSLTHTATVTLVVARPGVLYDNKVSSGFKFGVTTATTPAIVIGTGTNRAAMIMVTMIANNATNITASLGGVAGTLIPGTDTGTTATIRTLIFQVINPPSGSQTATVSWTTSMNVDVGVITVSGADPVTPCINGGFSAATENPGAATSLTIASSLGDLTASVAYTTNKWKTPYTNQTLKWGLDSTSAGGDIGPGTGTATHTWTDQYSFQSHAVSGANFKAAP